jgi:putative DNA primase/helicase
MSVANGKVHWERVKRGRPCRVCEREDGLCAIATDGSRAVCYRIGGPESTEKTSKAGVPYFVHRLDGQAEDNGHAVKPFRPPPARAHSDTLHEVYSALLTDPRLAFRDANLEDLWRRGMPVNEALRRLYASMPIRGRGDIAAELAGRFGKETLLSVPGFFVNDRNELGIAAFPGLVIPSRDPTGRIVALIVRPDKPPDPKHKYLYVSSANRDGPGPGAPAHVPLGVAGPVETVRLTEGPLKADLATILSDVPTIAAAGVTNWRPCLKVLKAIAAKTVRMAFDADWRVNALVAQAMIACVEAIAAEGLAVEFETWDPADGKGIDDLLAGGKAPQVLAGDDVKVLLRELELVAFPGGRPATSQPSARGSGDGRTPPPPRATEAAEEPRVNEATDDPHRLARIIRSLFVDATGHPILVHYRGNFYAWNGTAYRPDPVFISKTVVDEIKAEIDRQNLAAIAAHERDCSTVAAVKAGRPAPRPVAKKVTTALVKNVIQALTAMCGIDREGNAPFWIDTREGDPNPRDIIPARNGLVDIGGETPVLLAHTPRFFSTHALTYDYDPAAPEPVKWLAFLRDQWPDDDESIYTLHEMLGDMLTPVVGIHALHLWIGPPRSGRGTMRDVASDLVGRWNVTATSPGSLSGPFGLESLLDKKLAIMGDARTGDSHDSAVMMDRLLRITGGDPVEVNCKGKPMLPDVSMNLRVLMMSNEMPNFRDSSGAIVARYVVLNTTRTIPKEQRNPRLGEELKAELPGILNEAIAGLKTLRLRGRFLQPKSAEHLIDDAGDIASPIRVFVAERGYQLGESESVTTSMLFDDWKRWAIANGYQVGNLGTFGKNLKAAYPHIRKVRPREGREGEKREPTYQGIGSARPF